MNKVRLLPVVILAVAALLVLKTIGLVTNGGYVLGGVTVASAAGGGSGAGAPAEGASGEATLPGDHTIEDTAPTIGDSDPTVGATPDASGHQASSGDDTPAEVAATGHESEAQPADSADGAESDPGEDPANSVAAANACDPQPVAAEGQAAPESEADTSGSGQLLVIPADCPPLIDALPQLLTPDGPQLLGGGDSTLTEQALLQRLAERRKELETYEQDLNLRSSLVDAAEKRLEERSQTLQQIEGQISALVDQRKQMEEGQFAGIVAMYETMKPKDAAAIFNTLDIEVLLRVAKMMSPRKMAPILAEMDTQRAQELTVRMAALSDAPIEQMTPANLADLPQIVGQ